MSTLPIAACFDKQPERYSFEGHQVRVAHNGGDTLFAIADLCAVLGIANSSKAATTLDPDSLCTIETTDVIGRPQSLRAVDEGGMYELVMRSRKPQARAFKRWVTREVLPSIRKTGSYGVAAAPALSGEQLMAAALVEAQRVLAQTEQRVQDLAPAADAYDRIFGETATWVKPLTVQEAAKALSRLGVSIGAQRLHDTLRATPAEGGLSWTCRTAQGVQPTQYALDRKYMEVKVGERPGRNGSVYVTVSGRISAKGMDRLVKHFQRQQELEVF